LYSHDSSKREMSNFIGRNMAAAKPGVNCEERQPRTPAHLGDNSPDRGLQATSLFELIKANLRPMRLGNIEAA
jgi:hypothetical protein